MNVSRPRVDHTSPLDLATEGASVYIIGGKGERERESVIGSVPLKHNAHNAIMSSSWP